jgi:hypothetical protein
MRLAFPASSSSPATGDGRLGISSLPARPSSTPPPDGPALRLLLSRHPPSAPSQCHASGPSPSGTSVVRPQLAGRRASSVTGPSLEAIRERVGDSAAARLMGSGPPQITLTEVDSLTTTEVSHYDAGGRSGSTTPRVETMDEDRAQQLRGRDLPLQHVWSVDRSPPPLPSREAVPLQALTQTLLSTGPGRTRHPCCLMQPAPSTLTARPLLRSASYARSVRFPALPLVCLSNAPSPAADDLGRLASLRYKTGQSMPTTFLRRRRSRRGPTTVAPPLHLISLFLSLSDVPVAEACVQASSGQTSSLSSKVRPAFQHSRPKSGAPSDQ